MIDTRKQFQLQTGVFLKRPDVVTFDEYIQDFVPFHIICKFKNDHINRTEKSGDIDFLDIQGQQTL